MWYHLRITNLLFALATFGLGVFVAGLLPSIPTETEPSVESFEEGRAVVRSGVCVAQEPPTSSDPDTMTLDELEKSIRETEIELIRLKSRGPLRRPSESEDEVRKKLVELELKLIGLKLQAEYMRRDDRRGAKVIYPVYREFCYED